jgi:hypothetical protein
LEITLTGKIIAPARPGRKGFSAAIPSKSDGPHTETATALPLSVRLADTALYVRMMATGEAPLSRRGLAEIADRIREDARLSAAAERGEAPMQGSAAA